MKKSASAEDKREFDFALAVGGVPEVTQLVEDALFESGCDDATLNLRNGLLYIEFSRRAKTIQEAIFIAIRDIQRANIGAEVLCLEGG